jgi:hypothetical protein
MTRIGSITWATLAAGVLVAVGCTVDPVHEFKVSALGDEKGEANEFHRAGQPCTVCHQANGKAQTDFSVAGTVFGGADGLVGADGVRIDLVDSRGSSPPTTVRTNCVGNFFVPRSEWDPAFPLLVRLTRGGVTRTMRSAIGQEGSCAGCHKAELPLKDPLTTIGHLFVFPNTPPDDPAVKACPVNPVIQAPPVAPVAEPTEDGGGAQP